MKNREIRLPAGQSADDAAATRALARDLDAQLSADSRAVQRLTGQPVVVDPHAALGDQAAAVQQSADRVGFTDTMAAAYHARKVRHEALDVRVGVRDLRRSVVAAAGLKLGAA